MSPLDSEIALDLVKSQYKSIQQFAMNVFRDSFPDGSMGDAQFILEKWGPQSLHFAADMLAVMRDDLYDLRCFDHLTYLDVGAGPGHGAAFFQRLFQFGSPSLDVTALDQSPRWNEIYTALHVDVSLKFISSDIFDLDEKSYDIVGCSHVIEHLSPEYAVKFVNQLKLISRKFLVIICPWNESPELHPAHKYKIDESFLNVLAPDTIKFFNSFGWSHPNGCVGMIFRNT